MESEDHNTSALPSVLPNECMLLMNSMNANLFDETVNKQLQKRLDVQISQQINDSISSTPNTQSEESPKKESHSANEDAVFEVPYAFLSDWALHLFDVYSDNDDSHIEYTQNNA